jgi:hypothetical protein
MKEQLLRQSVIHVDETSMPLQRDRRVVKARQWTYSGRDPKIILYEFTEDKQGEHVRRYLAGWRGYLQADAASNYDELFASRPEIREVAPFTAFTSLRSGACPPQLLRRGQGRGEARSACPGARGPGIHRQVVHHRAGGHGSWR